MQTLQTTMLQKRMISETQIVQVANKTKVAKD